jgi:hypothetical protein
MRVRTFPVAVTMVAGAVAGSLALSPATVLASSSHGSHYKSKNVTVVKGDCNAVNGGTISGKCVTVSHSHHGYDGDGYYADGGYYYYHGHRVGKIGEGLGDVVEGVGDVLQGVLCAL